MKYFFFISTISKSKYYCIRIEEDKYSPLGRFTDDNWTPTMIQEIIDGVVSIQAGISRYEWSNEDIHIAAFPEGVFLFDLLARRGGKKGDGPDLKLTHIEFISFMQDFKKFIEENT